MFFFCLFVCCCLLPFEHRKNSGNLHVFSGSGNLLICLPPVSSNTFLENHFHP